MSTDSWRMEPPPWTEEDLAEARKIKRSKPWEPSIPMTAAQLDYWLRMPPEGRVFDAFNCMFNLTADDGIGYGEGTWVQCRNRIADPTKSRYCLDHAHQLGVEFYSPPEFSEATAKEANQNLTRLVPKAVKTLELVMDDGDAPPGIRAKAADSVLDRTGYAKGIDVRVDAQVAVVDFVSVIKTRLDALRDAQLASSAAVVTEATAGVSVVTGEIISGDVDGPAPSSSSDPAASSDDNVIDEEPTAS